MLDYHKKVGEKHRKEFGQFFTHSEVAAFMVNWVLDSGKKSLFDPAFGLGAFYDALNDRSKVRFTACEVDSKILKFWKDNTGKPADFVSIKDYLRSWNMEHECIVCNPPYMRFQKFLNRELVFQEFEKHLGIRISGYTNTASTFLLKSLSELTAGGRLAYIMPLEFLNTGYGYMIKQKLTEAGHLYGILSFDCEKNIFPDVTTSVGIILYDKARWHSSVKFFNIRTISELSVFKRLEPVSEVPLNELDAKEKWLPYFQKRLFEVNGDQTTTLEYFGRFSRGIATGANEFFVLKPTTMETRNINLETECIPCITKSSQIKKFVFEDSDFEDLLTSDKPVYLFSVNGRLSKSAKDYIRFGESKDYHERFLTKNRDPWYRTERRSPAPLLFGVFSRGAYKIILNRTRALNLTCYHGFQPNLFGLNYIEHLFLYFLSQTGREIISLSMRKYGDSLDKFEPNDLNRALVPTPAFLSFMPTEKISEAVKYVKETESLPKWVEDFFAPLRFPAKDC